MSDLEANLSTSREGETTEEYWRRACKTYESEYAKLEQENKRLKEIETRVKKRVIELIKEDDEDLKRTRKNFPRWTDEQVESVHEIDNYNKMIIDELTATLEGN